MGLQFGPYWVSQKGCPTVHSRSRMRLAPQSVPIKHAIKLPNFWQSEKCHFRVILTHIYIEWGEVFFHMLNSHFYFIWRISVHILCQFFYWVFFFLFISISEFFINLVNLPFVPGRFQTVSTSLLHFDSADHVMMNLLFFL